MIVITAAFPMSAAASEIPPFQDILNEYGLEYHEEQYIVTKEGNDYYFYSLNMVDTVKLYEGNYIFDPNYTYANLIAYKFSYPNYYLKPFRQANYHGNYAFQTSLNGNIINSSFDVKLTGSDTVVFQSSPLTTQAATVKGVVMTTDLKRSLSELVALIPVLLPCIICFMSIRKGLKFTFSMLRAA